ncbi:MAG: hypothetical protein ACRD38_02205 [Nitrososphaerales archaeon]
MITVLKKPFNIVVFVVSASVITAFLIAYRWLSGVFNIRDLGFIIAMLAVLLFMAFMILNLRTIKRPERYMLEVYNTLGEKDDVNFRREFKNYDVASSYMLMYRKMYPRHSFILVSDSEDAKKTVHRYLE